MFPRGTSLSRGRVTKRERDDQGHPMGHANPNPILQTWQYILEFDNGTKAKLAVNAIAQSMYAQCDENGNQYLLFDSIVDFHRSTTALCYADQAVQYHDRTYMKRITAGWYLCIQWKDRST